jgi:5-methylcytosine-specific restriction protein B
VLNTSLSAMDSVALDAFAGRLREILWGDGDVATRIDRALDWNDLGTKGLGESVLLKLFAITEPQRFLPTFPLTGPMGKIAMLRRLGLPEPESTLSRGQQHVLANDTIRNALEPLLPGDPWGQAQFTYWLLNHDIVERPEDEDRIAQTAQDLLVPEAFLRELAELLQEKGQLIFYGPPGTGKTFLADRFAAALQPDPERRMLIQFHPSTSYEDFFEGYRPRTDERGQLSYELRPGPLALMAEKAESNPGVPHFLIIDEINRANLPRVFGEMLFLLEYRNKAVRTAYRPDEPFELPRNLYFIGTMNTADRSIAMVDAALRRRFHFIPFMPHEGAMKSLLTDWLNKHNEPAWVAGLVDQVNEQLRILLKGPHLQVGHSHFMVKRPQLETRSLTDERLARIWEYDVYPFIEDQLYGRPDQLDQFTWTNVYTAYGPSSTVGTAATEVAQQNASDEPNEPFH